MLLELCIYAYLENFIEHIFTSNDKYFNGSSMHCEQYFEENCILAVRIKVSSYGENFYECTVIGGLKCML